MQYVADDIGDMQTTIIHTYGNVTKPSDDGVGRSHAMHGAESATSATHTTERGSGEAGASEPLRGPGPGGRRRLSRQSIAGASTQTRGSPYTHKH